MEVVKFIRKTIVFILIGIVIFVCITPIFVPKWYDDNEGTKYSGVSRRIKGMYNEPENTLDVVFLGNSDMYNGISTMKLWADKGITSYHIGSAQQNTWTAYYLLKDFYKTQSPKVAVIDVDFCFNEKVGSRTCLRQVIDCMPFSLNKLQMIFDPVYKTSTNGIISYLFPLLRYHSRWTDITIEEIKNSYTTYDVPFKGYDLWKQKKNGNPKNNKIITEIPSNCKDYLDKIVDLCEQNNTEVILVYVPTKSSWTQEKSDLMSEYASEKGLTFIDYNLEDFDWNNNTRDGGRHLNVYGAEDIATRLEGELDKYDLSDHSDDEAYANWNEDYELYEKVKEEE